MAWKTARTVGNVALISGDAMAAFAWLFSQDVFGWIEIGPPVYAGVITFLTGLLVVFNFSVIRARLPKERFFALHELIYELIEENETLGDNAMPDTLHAKVIHLARELDRLKIPYPNPPTDDSRPWWAWLKRLYGFSCTKDIKGAKGDQKTWEKYFGSDAI